VTEIVTDLTQRHQRLLARRIEVGLIRSCQQVQIPQLFADSPV